jgi:2,5-diketo-D-gluconate reductase A
MPGKQIPLVPLRGGSQIPQLGFGVFQIPPAETAEVVERALAAGYRHIDTAAAYRNEAAVGEAIRASGLDRSEVFLTATSRRSVPFTRACNGWSWTTSTST